MEATLTYFYQSGFSIGVDKTLLIFSYFENTDVLSRHKYALSPRELRPFNNIVVFIPNRCREHFDPAVFEFPKLLPIEYVVSDDAKDMVPEGVSAHIVQAGDVLQLDNVAVEVCPSSGLGVSYFVRVNGVRIFHAGDLNLWHWHDEGNSHDTELATARFESVMASLPTEPMDLCMFPLDPNQGRYFDSGANRFIMRLKPRVFVPMHWRERDEIAASYAQQSDFADVAICVLRYPRQSVVIDFSPVRPIFKENGAQELYGNYKPSDDIDINIRRLDI